MYDVETILEYVKEEDIKFIRLAFVDVYGKIKNVSVMPHELKRVFENGMSIDAYAVPGFGGAVKSDLFLCPDPSTISLLPWRPSQGRVIRMNCDIKYPDGTIFECDSRAVLKDAIKYAADNGVAFNFGSEIEFYLFKLDDQGNPTTIPYDRAGYMDVAPDDLCENVRRNICLTLEDMGVLPESSHHEEGPAQNEIDFRYAEPLKAAQDAVTFKSVVRTIANANGLAASFAPKPLPGEPGNGYHINFSTTDPKYLDSAIAGILEHASEMTAFLNCSKESYARLGKMSAPKYISCDKENRNTLIRIPAAKGEYVRAELRSPDPELNPYIAFSLIIRAAIDGIKKKLPLPKFVDIAAGEENIKGLKELPKTLEEAKAIARESQFIREALPEALAASYLK